MVFPPCRCYPGVGDLDASDDEDTVLLENPAYEDRMRKSLKVCCVSRCPNTGSKPNARLAA